MIITNEVSSLDEFEAWGGAEETKSVICEAGKGEEFITALEDSYPNGISETDLNDLLWYSPEYCYGLVGVEAPSEEI